MKDASGALQNAGNAATQGKTPPQGNTGGVHQVQTPGGPGGMAGGSMPNPNGGQTTGAQAPPSQGGYTGGPGGFQNAMNAQFGSNNPFSPNANYNVMGGNFTGTGGNAALGAGTALGDLANMSKGNQWYGDSPIATAQAAAQQQLDKNLAALQNRYGATGGGNSARAGLASGTAVGEMGTNLGAKLAELGIGARQGDIQNAINAQQGAGQLGLGVGNLGLGAGANYNDQVKTALSAMLGAGGLNNDAVKNQLTAAGLMGDMGKNVTGIGAGEQAPANMNSILSLLGMFSGGSTTGGGSASGSQGSGFLGK